MISETAQVKEPLFCPPDLSDRQAARNDQRHNVQ